MREHGAHSHAPRTSTGLFGSAYLHVLAALLACLLLCASAQANSGRGHVLSESLSFGSPGKGAGQLSEPSGAAVNEKTGDVYVLDRGNNRIDRFDAGGQFLEAWGWGVRTGAKEYQRCDSGSGCQKGLAGGGRGELREAGSIAIDNSTSPSDPSAGDLYVETLSADEELERPGRIEKFSPTGTVLGRVTREGERFEEELHGLTVGPDGTLWVYDEEVVLAFTDGLTNEFSGEFEPEEVTSPQRGVAVNRNGDFLLAQKPLGDNSPTLVGAFNSLGEVLTEGLSGDPESGFATDPLSGDIYVDNISFLTRYGPDLNPIETLGEGQLSKGSGIGVDGASELLYVPDARTGRVLVYAPEPVGPPKVDDLNVTARTTSSATLTAAINAAGSPTVYSFRYGTGPVPPWTGAGAGACTGACHETPSGSAGSAFGDVALSQSISGLTPASTYHYRVLAKNHALGATNLTEYPGGERLFNTAPPSLVLADSRRWDMVSPAKKGNGIIEAIPREGGLIEAAPDGAGLAYISDGAVSGTAVEPEGNHSPGFTQLLGMRKGTSWSSWDLDTRVDRAEGIVPGERSEYFWFSTDLTHSLLETTGTQRLERPPLTQEASERTPYLRLDPIGEAGQAHCAGSPVSEECFTALVNSSNDPPGPAEVAGKQLPEGNHFGGNVKLAGASPDLSHVALDSSVPLTPEAVPSTGNVYEWAAGTLKLASVLPDGTPAPGAVLGIVQGKDNMADHAVSSDGSRLIWTVYGTNGSVSTTPSALYMRDMSRSETVRLDVFQPGVTPTTSKPIYQTASSDGSRIFFTDQAALTIGSHAEASKPDLYVCDIIENQAHEIECRLSDLTAITAHGEAGDVQGVIGAGSTGESIYYVANGALAPGATRGYCRPEGLVQSKNTGEAAELAEEALPIVATCELYVSRLEGGNWSSPDAIAKLSGEDQPDWLSTKSSKDEGRGPLNGLTSRVSPDGKLLAFMSDRSLTGYPTRDAVSGRADEEVYFYDSGQNVVRCASCNPTGERPHGIHDVEDTPEGIGPLIDRQLIWTDRWLSGNLPGWTPYNSQAANYQSRYLDDSGRMFFNSTEELVPQDRNGKADVYEYEPAGLGDCTGASEDFQPSSAGCVSLISSGTSTQESAFLDASESGNDAFFITSAPLSPTDLEADADVYDASVCGQPGAHACASPPAAEEAECSDAAKCRGGHVELPAPVPPAATDPGPGDVSSQHQVLSSKTTVKPPTRAQKLAAALRHCRRTLRPGKRRHGCEAQAHRRYGKAKSALQRGSGR